MPSTGSRCSTEQLFRLHVASSLSPFVPGGIRIGTYAHGEGEEDRHKSPCWKQQSIFILPPLQRQSSASALLGSGSTHRQAALGQQSLRLWECLSAFPYRILFLAEGI